MKQTLITKAKLYIFFCLIILCSNLIGCNKHEPFPFPGGGNNSADKYSADVIDKWITIQIRLMRNSTGIANVAFSRYYSYSGIAAYESLTPGTTLSVCSNKWNGLTGLPQPELFKKYYWPASVNTALADMNRSMFINASTTDKAAIDSLETALNNSFTGVEADVIARSNAFGKGVGDAVFNWSETDGYKNANNAYTPPVGPGLWMPTPPAYAPASTPYWGNNRVLIAGSTDNTLAGPPISYSETPGSAFYKMVKELYDTSHALTTDEMNQALFWRDVPGVTTPGHWLSILQQVIQQTGSRLDKAAFAYAITGTCLNDAAISCWQNKYKYNQVRPVTYIRKVFGDTSWLSFIPTPAHPEYPCAHCFLSAATADAFTEIYGNIGTFTDHTYDYLGFPSRKFSSFQAIATDAGKSRFYGGIHYKPSIDTGLIQGSKVAANIFMKLGFSKTK